MDLFDSIKVEKEIGQKLAADNGALFCETSAKEDSQGFKRFVDKLVREYISKKKINLKNKI